MVSPEYQKAYKMARKEYQARYLKGQNPFLEVLDDMLPSRGMYSEVPLGLVQIPMELIVGTKTGGRSTAFAANFMPIMDEKTEFAAKWMALSEAHVSEGIRDPIKVYEYYNKFYVLEGNKRVSVLKFYEAVSMVGEVIRILPPKDNRPENILYYEFVDFYDCTQINYIWFTKIGSFKKLQKLMGKAPGEVWSEEERLNFSSLYNRFELEYTNAFGKKYKITPADAFLSVLQLYSFEELLEISTADMKKLVNRSSEEFDLKSKDEEVELKLDSTQEKKKLVKRLLPLDSHLKIAFIYEKNPHNSSWAYAHELGRNHLEETFPDEVETVVYQNITLDAIEDTLENALRLEKCDMVFTTSPCFAKASVKYAMLYPKAKILNCSLNTSHRYIRTYYPRMDEAKFLMGAIAGAMAENDKIGYIADYPLFGTIANINAFALGAKMINPRAQIYLEWSGKKNVDNFETFRENDVHIISGREMILPERASRYFGLYELYGDWPRSLAMPITDFGKIYEKLIRTVMDGTWNADDSIERKAVNYWMGMKTGVCDVVFSKNLPIGTIRLIDLLKNTIHSGEFDPFSGVLYSQEGVVQHDSWAKLSPKEVVEMDWLAENVIGSIPKTWEMNDSVQPTVLQQGVEKAVK